MDLLDSDHPVDLEINRSKPKEATATLEAADPRIRSLRAWFCGLKSMDVLARFTKLRTLIVSDWLAPDFEVLRQLPKLEYLSVLHLPKISDLTPLGSLSHLKTLELSTLPSWDASSKVQAVKSLDPLGKLASLKFLRLWAVVPADGRLDGLAAAAALKEVELSDNFSLEALARLAALRPKLGITPGVKIDHIKCKECGAPSVMLQGLKGTRRPRWACSECQRERIEAHEAEFEKLKAAAG